MTSEKRIFGFDLLRTTAVLLVIFHHSIGYIQYSAWMRYLGGLGSLGVDFLLVLTGYLVGRSLLKKIGQQKLSGNELRQFYFRRWLRTLPPYLVFFFIMAALEPSFFQGIWKHLQYLVFLQNFAWTVPAFYGQTWTLAVQEFFYLLCPLILMTGYWIFRRPYVAFFVPVTVMLLVPLILRMAHTQVEDATGFEEVIRKWVIFRFDTPVIGVILAFVELEAPFVWLWLIRHSWLAFTFAGGIAGYFLAGCPFRYSSHWVQVIFFPVVACGIALLFPWLSAWKENKSLVGRAIGGVSNMTYSIYVSHYAAFTLAYGLMIMRPIHSWPIVCMVYLFLTWAVAYPSYLLIEAPILAMRRSEKPRRSYFITLYRRCAGAIRSGIWERGLLPSKADGSDPEATCNR